MHKHDEKHRTRLGLEPITPENRASAELFISTRPIEVPWQPECHVSTEMSDTLNRVLFCKIICFTQV